MLISAIILVIAFFLMIFSIALNKIERTILALIAALSTFIVLVFIEHAQFYVFVEFLFGTKEDDFLNLHSLILILGMMIIVQIAVEGGTFQYLGFKFIQWTKGQPKYLILVFGFLATFITAIINDILAAFVLIPLTVTVCRILDIKPQPYIIMEAILFKMGASILLISSVPNILIAGYAGITFTEFFLTVGIISIGIFGLTLFLFYLLFKNKLKEPRKGIDILMEFNVGDLIPDKLLMRKSIGVLIGVMICFIAIPQEILGPDIISIAGAIILLTICPKNIEETFKKLDFKLILYLSGVFIISGALEYVGFISLLALMIGQFTTNDLLLTILMAMWISAVFSSVIDNIPITKILVPTIGSLSSSYSHADQIRIFSAMACGVVWGDNLSPFGDTLLVLNVAEQNKEPFKLIDFFKLGFPITIIQLFTVTVIYCLMLEPILGLFLSFIPIGVVLLIFAYTRRESIAIKSNHVSKPSTKKKKVIEEEEI